MEVVVRNAASRKIIKLRKRYPDILVLLDQAFESYRVDPKNPKLRLHKLVGVEKWSISIKSDLRVVFVYWRGDVTVVDIGSHDEVYR